MVCTKCKTTMFDTKNLIQLPSCCKRFFETYTVFVPWWLCPLCSEQSCLQRTPLCQTIQVNSGLNLSYRECVEICASLVFSHSLIRVHASVGVRILSHSSSLWIIIGWVRIQIPQVLWEGNTNTDLEQWNYQVTGFTDLLLALCKQIKSNVNDT